MNLRLLQLGDSALPIGGYSHSWGLEAAIASGRINDAPSLERWTRNWLIYAAAPLEGVVVAAVCRAVGATDFTVAAHANEILWATITPQTLRHASRDMGEQLLGLVESWPWANEFVGQLRAAAPDIEWHHAPVFGALAATSGGCAHDATAVYLHQAALGVVTAGVRAIPIGHTHGQEIVARVHSDIEALAKEVCERPLEMAGSSCPAHEVFCYEQSRLYTRLFRS